VPEAGGKAEPEPKPSPEGAPAGGEEEEGDLLF